MSTHSLPCRALLLPLLLTACGPGKADPESTSEAGSDTEVGGSATGDAPTGHAPTGDDPTSDSPTSDPTITGATTTDPPPGTTSDTTRGGSSDATGDTSTGDASRGRLIGLAFAMDSQQWDTVELDPFSGELTVLATLPAEIASIAQGVSAFDPATRRIFQTTEDGRLLVLDADSGEFIAARTLTPAGLAGLVDIELGGAGGLIALALGDEATTVSIDPDTGIITALAVLPFKLPNLLQGTGTLDPGTGRMFQLSGDGQLIVIDASTGALLDDLTLVPGGGLLDLAVDNAGELVGLTTASFPNPWEISRVDPLTGVVTKLSELASGTGFLQGQMIHDPAADRLFVQTSDPFLLVIDAATGELLATTPIVPDDHGTFLNPEFVL